MSSLGKKNRRQAAMQAFREGRGGGLADLELPNEDDVYDVVEENDYQQLVESRRQREDFVVNDGEFISSNVVSAMFFLVLR